MHEHIFLYVCHSRPGVLKDLKTMGSISLFIFFITLLVLARQVSPHNYHLQCSLPTVLKPLSLHLVSCIYVYVFISLTI